MAEGALGEVPTRGGADKPRWLGRAVAAVWFLLLATAIAACLFGASQGLRDLEQAPVNPFLPLGLRPVFTDEVALAPFGAEALASGIRFGDRLVTVEGHPIESRAGALALNAEEGTRVRIAIRSNDGWLTEHRLTRSRSNVALFFTGSGFTPDTYVAVNIAINVMGVLALVAAAVLLFRQRSRGWAAGLMSCSFLLLSIFLLSGAAFSILGIGAWRMIGLPIALSLFTLALMIFPNGRFEPRWMRWMTVPLALNLVAGWLGLPVPILLVAGSGLLLLTLGALILRYLRLPPGTERQQIRWALFGFWFGMALLLSATAINQFVLTSDVSRRAWVWFVLALESSNSLAFVAAAGGLLVSLLRYRLYDADAVISRSVSFGALTVLLLALFAGTEKVIEVLGEEWFGESLGALAGGLGAAVAAALIVPLHHRLTRWAERRFQKQLIRLRTGLPALVGDLRETASARRIAAATLDSVVTGVRASRAAVMVDAEVIDARGIDADAVGQWRQGWLPAAQDGFDIDRADPLFPLRIPLEADGHGRVGWLLLGPRPDGSFYGRDERETLAQIADPVARALEIAQRRQSRETADQKRWHMQEALNDQLAVTLSSMNAKLDQLTAAVETLLPPIQAVAPRARKARARKAVGLSHGRTIGG